MDLSEIKRWLTTKGIDYRYVYVTAGSLALFVTSCLLALDTMPSGAEISVFRWFNQLPGEGAGVMTVVSAVGDFPGALIPWSVIAYLLGRYRLLIRLVFASLASMTLAFIFKDLIGRGRPGEILLKVNDYGQHFDGFGIPSGHATLITACTTVLIVEAKPKYRPYLIGIALLVGLSRLYLGGHFPLDVIAGWALGVTTAIVSIIVVGQLGRFFLPFQTRRTTGKSE